MRLHRRLLAGVAAALVLALLVVETPLLEYLEPAKLQRAIGSLAGHPLLPFMLLGAFLLAGALFVSVWLVIAQTALLYGPAASIPLALGGALLAAVTFYVVGRLLGAELVQRLVPQRVQRAVHGAGMEAIFAVRLVPLLPFTLVNLCAGAFHVELRTYVLGTVLGMGPGILAVCLLGDQLLELLQHPSPRALAGVAAGAIAVGSLLFVLRRRAHRAMRDRAIARASRSGEDFA